MKILNLKFKNINSLSGENEIDFTNPLFTNDGLFLISGKTGSGKTSILDAISLALYGKTPRVAISGSENPVMTKGEKDCYAEIVFETAGNIWKSSWKQELNRNGNLKPVNRTIANSKNEIVADQVNSCNLKIIEITGLKFEHFTKVIMLAQGSFAAFLQANKNEKGELLEQITGTEQYAQISKNVYERNKEEKEILNNILIELSTIQVLSEDEVSNLSNENALLEKKKKQVDEDLKKIEIEKNWLKEISDLQSQINEAKQKLPDLNVKITTANEYLQKAEADLKKIKEEQSKLEPIFKRVYELETQISEKEKMLIPISNSISELDMSKRVIFENLKIQKDNFERLKKTLEEKQNWETKNKKYERLVSSYSAIEKENTSLLEKQSNIENLKIEVIDLQKDFESKRNLFNTAVKNLTEKNNLLTAINNELELKRKELTDILCGKTISSLQIEKDNKLDLLRLIHLIVDCENEISTSQNEIESIDKKLRQYEISRKDISEKRDVANKSIEALEHEINLLNENINLKKIIQSLDEHRRNLKDGEICPLCGSTNHPFAKGNISQIDENEKILSLKKEELQDFKMRFKENEKLLTELNSDNQNNIRNREKEEILLNNNIEKRNQLFKEIKNIDPVFSIPNGENKLDLLNKLSTNKTKELNELIATIKKAEDSDSYIRNLCDTKIPKLQTTIHISEDQKNKIETDQKLTEQELKNKEEFLKLSIERYRDANAEFLANLKSFDAENIEGLKKCLETWLVNKKQVDDLLSQIANLNNDIALNTNNLENKTNLYEIKQQEKQNLEIEKQKLAKERNEIFAEKSAAEEENRIKISIDNAESERNKAVTENNNANLEFEKIKAIIIDKENKLKTTQAEKIAEKTLEELQVESTNARNESDNLSREIGANIQTLKLNEECLNKCGKKLKEKEKQEEICRKWGNLNDLIGSTDGIKYRNFVQTLTFEHLIALSNIQLNKMTDRYILKRTGDASSPFDLSVIDKFQNGDERTVQNISGGEKFIVSLSLALGLANMVSKNMRIDTMFIDEGFGTLDPDYLDVALNVLSNLQSEGKIIGVISHLPELKERIATHIEVVSAGDGHSQVQITN